MLIEITPSSGIITLKAKPNGAKAYEVAHVESNSYMEAKELANELAKQKGWQVVNRVEATP